MAVKTNYNYEDFENPYNNTLDRSDTIPSSNIASTYGSDVIQNPGDIGENVLDGQSIDNLVIKSWIKSANYRPKTHGFIIDGKLGYIECMQLYVGSGGIVGGSLDIPNFTTVNSFHVDSTGNMWLGLNTAGPITLAPAYILNTGEAAFTNIKIHGRGGKALADAIDEDSNLVTDVINDALNTSAGYILKGFGFGASDYEGGISAGSLLWDPADGSIISGSGVVLNRNGLLGANAGTPTFTISADTGEAYFSGAIGSGTSITAPVITGGSVTGALVTGGTVRAGTYDSSYMELGDVSGEPYLRGYILAERRMQLDNDSLEFFNASTYKELEITQAGVKFFLGDASVSPLGSIESVVGAIEMIAPFGNYVNLVGSYSVGSSSSYPVTVRAKAGSTYKEVFSAGYIDSTGLSHLTMAGASQLITSGRFTADDYINFGLSASGDTGYGIRQSGGVMQYKNSTDAGWTAIPSGGGGGSLPAGTWPQMLYYNGSDWVATSDVYVGPDGNRFFWETGVYYNGFETDSIRSATDFTVAGRIHTNGSIYTGSGRSVNTSYLNDNLGYPRFSIHHATEITCHNLFRPISANTLDLGTAAVYWKTLHVKDITKGGGGGWGFFDEGVEMQDGRILSDSEAFLAMRPHPTKKTKYGKPIIDLESLPKQLRAGEEGEDVFATISLLIGVAREYAARIKELENKLNI